MTREYAVDPLEATFVKEVMDADIYTTDPERGVPQLYRALTEERHAEQVLTLRRVGARSESSPAVRAAR